ncbi:DUF4625 domain-containing protein [bacterium]|nr:DUF4625 domain-containing protein [bacterium]
MNNKFTYMSLVLLGLSVLVSACYKDKENPVINITSPIIHDHYSTRDTIHFTGTVTDNEALKSIEVYMFTEDDPTRFYDKRIDVSGTSYTINEMYIVTTTDTDLEYHFQVTAIDEAGNSADSDPENHVHINL